MKFFLSEFDTLLMYINLHTRSHIYLKISIFCKKMIAFSSTAHLMEKSTFLPKFQFFSHKIDIFAPKLILTKTLVTLPQRLHDIILGEMLTFSLSVHYYWKWLSFCKICLFSEKCDIFCQILIKKNTIS